MAVSPAKARLKFARLGIDHLWLFGVLASFGILISLAPQPPHDFWWHLKIGEMIYSSGMIPCTNLFGWTLPADTPYVYGAWLADVLFYSIYRLGGVALILFTRTMLALTAYGLLGYEAYRKSGSWRISGLVTALACLMTANNLIVRPQNWSWIPFVIFLILLSAYVDGQLRGGWLFLCPLMMIFWVNVHGSFILGVVLIGVFFGGEIIRNIFQIDGFLSWKALSWIGIVGMLTILAMLVNPQLAGIFPYVVKLMTDPSSQTLIMEWQSPVLGDLGSVFFFVSILVLITVWAYKRYRPTPSETLLILAFLWLAWSGVRYVVWFGMAAMPILARSLKDILRGRIWVSAPARNFANGVLVIVLFIPFVLFQPWLIEKMPLPDQYWSRVWKGSPIGPLLTIDTPIGAVEYLKDHPGGRLFNHMGHGSYLIWALPEQGVFVDPRVELYPYDLWLDYIKISNGLRYNQLLEKYNVDRLLLDVEEQGELISLLGADPLWRQEYSDAHAQIWIKEGTRIQ